MAEFFVGLKTPLQFAKAFYAFLEELANARKTSNYEATIQVGGQERRGPVAKLLAGTAERDELFNLLEKNTFLVVEKAYVKQANAAMVSHAYNPNLPAPKLDVVTSDAAFLEILGKHFELKHRRQVTTELVAQVSQETQLLLAETVQNLGHLIDRVTGKVAENVAKWDSSIHDLSGKLQREFDQRREKLDAEVQAKREALDKKEIDFEERVKSFDDRERTHVRRDLLDKIKEQIAAQRELELSAGTKSKHRAVNLVCAIGLLAAAAVAGVLVRQLLTGTGETHWYLYALTSTSILAAVSTFIYALRWNSRWYADHANVEFWNIRFAADILRASWLAELVFEYNEEKSVAFPHELLPAFSKNLFEERSSKGGVQHPVEDILSMAGTISKLRVGKGALEVETREPKEVKA